MSVRKRRLGLRGGVLLMAVIALIVLAGGTAMISSRFSDAQRAGEEVAYRLQPAADTSNALDVSLGDMQRGLRGYVITDKATALAPYAEGFNQSQSSLVELQQLLAESEPALAAIAMDVAKARQVWLDVAARPTIDAVRDGRQAEADARVDSSTSKESYALLQAQALYLDDQIDERRNQEFTDLTDFATQLSWVLAFSGVALLLVILFAVVSVTLGVVKPLNQLRAQLRAVAGGQRNSPIEPSGPAEIEQAGRDAENMRRQLVARIDEAEMATQGLEQEGPVVVAIRAELTREPQVSAVGVNVFGEQLPAEGVLAGDWWDAYSLPDGRTAIVVVDVSGHGPDAGVIGLRLKLTIASVLETGGSLQEAISRGERLFAEEYSRFATCVGVVIDPQKHEVEWVNAGHLLPILIDAAGAVRELETTGPLLSSLGGVWQARRIEMAVTDTLILWTDGLTEARDAAGDQLEDEGLHAMVAQLLPAAHGSPAELVHLTLSAARARATDEQWKRDDITLIAARFED